MVPHLGGPLYQPDLVSRITGKFFLRLSWREKREDTGRLATHLPAASRQVNKLLFNPGQLHEGQGLLACLVVFLLGGKGPFHSLVAEWSSD